MKCKMIREEKIEFTTKWCKYSKYMIEKKDDKYYMLPDKMRNQVHMIHLK